MEPFQIGAFLGEMFMMQTMNEEKETITIAELQDEIRAMEQEEFMMEIAFGGDAHAKK